MILRGAILAIGLLFAAVVPVQAQSSLGPVVPKATGHPHPEGNDYMRRYHMEMMKHDRDLTMYDGVRPVNASLAQCFDCHTVQDAAGIPVTVKDERHFCRVCHDFTAVRMDCFDCHRSTPDGFEEPPLHASRDLETMTPDFGSDDVQVLQAYLEDLEGRAAELGQ